MAETVFTKTEIDNEWNANFIQNRLLRIQDTSETLLLICLPVGET